jgi:pimeloyl-ACP methyl ester carboxylesterase
MGGWLGLMLASRKPERIKALIGIAAAPDFTEDLMWLRMTPDQRAQLEHDGFIEDGYSVVTLKLIEEARQHLLLRASIPVSCPVRLIQGLHDEEVPWQHTLRITENIAHDDVRTILVKDGDHRLSRPQDLDLLWQTVDGFL